MGPWLLYCVQKLVFVLGKPIFSNCQVSTMTLTRFCCCVLIYIPIGQGKDKTRSGFKLICRLTHSSAGQFKFKSCVPNQKIVVHCRKCKCACMLISLNKLVTTCETLRRGNCLKQSKVSRAVPNQVKDVDVQHHPVLELVTTVCAVDLSLSNTCKDTNQILYTEVAVQIYAFWTLGFDCAVQDSLVAIMVSFERDIQMTLIDFW